MTDKKIKVITYALLPFVLSYFFSMFIWPITKLDWSHIEAVWDRWQSLNVGMLAFLSSVIAFNISRYNATKQRERDYIAARAFLPEALSSLCSYLQKSTIFLKEASNKISSKDTSTQPKAEIPKQPIDHREAFSKCIALGEADIGNHLADILMKLQIHNARMNSLSEGFGPNITMVLTHNNILSHFYITAELYALISVMFDEARGMKKFKATKLSIENMTNAYQNLNVYLETVPNLAEYTKNKLEQK